MMGRRTKQQIIDDENMAAEIAYSEAQEVFDLRERVDFYITERDNLMDDKRKLQQQNAALVAYASRVGDSLNGLLVATSNEDVKITVEFYGDFFDFMDFYDSQLQSCRQALDDAVGIKQK